MSSLSGLPNVGSLIPSIDNTFIKFAEIPLGRKTCDVCGDYFSITGDLKDCPVGLPCRHVHCFGCTWTWLHRNHSCPECDMEYTDIRPICVALEREAHLCRHQGLGQSQVEPRPFLNPAADFMDACDDNATIAHIRGPEVRGPSDEEFRSSIGPTAEEIEGEMTLMHLHTEKNSATPKPTPLLHVCSGTDLPTQKFETEMPSEQLRANQEWQPDWQTMYEQQLCKEKNLRKEKNRRNLARLHKKRAQETDSERAERLEKQRVSQREYQANRTDEQRAKRLETVRRRRHARRAREMEDEHEERLAKMRKGGKRIAKQ